MASHAVLEDTALASLISSKICHDLAGQIGAINNGLELLEEESDDDTRFYALELIQNSAKLAWAQLDFHRLAFGASSSLGSVVPVGQIENVARRYIETAKRRLHWQNDAADIGKHEGKFLLAFLAVAMTALPAGGDLYVGLASAPKKGKESLGALKAVVLCRGKSARIPDRVAGIWNGTDADDIDTRLILAYYVARLASEAGTDVAVSKDGEDVVFTAQPKKA